MRNSSARRYLLHFLDRRHRLDYRLWVVIVELEKQSRGVSETALTPEVRGKVKIPEKQDKNQCLHLKALLVGHNPLMHPNMNITRQMMLTTYCTGLHPEAKLLAIECRDDLVHAAQKG